MKKSNKFSPEVRERAVRMVQEFLGHRDVSTTMVYTHVLNKCRRGVLSPFDAL